MAFNFLLPKQPGQSFRVSGDPVPKLPKEITVEIEDLIAETGPVVAEPGDTVVMKYEGKLDDGSVFDSSNSFTFTLGDAGVLKWAGEHFHFPH